MTNRIHAEERVLYARARLGRFGLTHTAPSLDSRPSKGRTKGLFINIRHMAWICGQYGVLRLGPDRLILRLQLSLTINSICSSFRVTIQRPVEM